MHNCLLLEPEMHVKRAEKLRAEKFRAEKLREQKLRVGLKTQVVSINWVWLASWLH